MLVHSFISEPVASVYDDLIEYCLDTSDAFLLVFRNHKWCPEYKERMAFIRNELSPYRLKTRRNMEWPGTTVGGGAEFSDPDNSVDLYRATMKLLSFLQAPQKLYNWRPPLYPEDLCFFRKNKCWFEITAHEKMGGIYCFTKNDKSILSKLGIMYKENEIDYPCFVENINYK